MTSVLTSSDFPAIRTVLAVTNADIQDNDFNTAGIVPAVNAIYLVPVPDFSLLAGNDIPLAKASAVYFAAYMAVPIVQIRNGRRIKIGDFESQDNKVDWVNLSNVLSERSKHLLMSTSVWQNQQKRRTLLAATGPTSSGSNWPWAFDQWRSLVMPLVVVWAMTNGMDSNWFLQM